MSSNKLVYLGMEGVISNYRRSRHVIHPKHCVIVFPNINTRKEANKMIGKIVVWMSPTGKELKGVITRAHGNNGAVKARFKKAGLPGQALGKKVKITK
jgi:large subunit ribosomal protein L35Ae